MWIKSKIGLKSKSALKVKVDYKGKSKSGVKRKWF